MPLWYMLRKTIMEGLSVSKLVRAEKKSIVLSNKHEIIVSVERGNDIINAIKNNAKFIEIDGTLINTSYLVMVQDYYEPRGI